MAKSKAIIISVSIFFSLLCLLTSAWALSIPGPELDQHNTVYSYNISKVALDADKKLHITMTVHMCPYCCPYNNYVKVHVEAIGEQYTRNTPVGTTYTHTFTFDASSLEVGDIVRINSDVWCAWCGHWYDSKTFKVEMKIVEGSGGLGSSCQMTLVEIGSAVNVANGNMFDSYQVSPAPNLPVTLNYNSRSVRDGRFGFGWHDSADIRLVKETDGTIILIEADGQEENFIANGDGTFTSPPGNHDELQAIEQVVFADDMEGTTGQWLADPPWGRVTTSSHSPSTSWTDSPAGNYANNIHKSLTLPLDLSDYSNATLNFWHHFAIETGYDYGYIEISKDGGANWTMLKSYTGYQNAWAQQNISLDSYAGLSGLLLRFRLITDYSITADGWYIDDVEIIGGTGYQVRRKGGELIYFDQSGNPLRIEDRNGNATVFSYNSGVISAISDPDGKTLYFISDANGRITAIIDSLDRIFSFAYDSEGNLTTITNSSGEGRSFSYDADHNLTEKVDPLGRVTLYAYDDEDRLVSATDAEGNTRSLVYSATGVTTFIDPAGNATEFTYNETFNVTKEVDAQGNVTEYGWDSDQNRVSVQDASGTVAYEYDDHGNMLSRTDQLGHRSSYTYDSAGNVLSVTEPDGSVTTNTYDANGNLLSTTDAQGNTTTYQYDAQGRIIATTDAMGRTTTYAYDAEGNLASFTDPVGAVTFMTYDAAGNMVAMTDPAGNTTNFEYDALNRPVKVIDPLGNETHITYDAMGNRTSITDAEGNTTSFTYDHRNRVTRIIDALGGLTELTYSEAGCPTCGGGSSEEPATVTDANGNLTLFLYDALGKLINETDPLENAVSYTYDAQGNLAGRTDANGNTVTYSHDPLGRLLAMNYPDGSITTFTYDPNGKMLTAANQHISYSMTYDVLGRLTSSTDSNNRSIAYQYNAVGNRVQMTGPDGKTVSYAYDDANRLSLIRSWAGVFEFSYDDLGRRTGLNHSNGVTINYSYDSVSRLLDILARTGRGDIVSAFTYTHDAVGNRLSKATSSLPGNQNMRADYSYDPTYQLLESIPVKINPKGKEQVQHSLIEDFEYDPVGNRLAGPQWQDTYAYNPDNQLLESRKYDYQYDASGNLIAKTGFDDDQTAWTYEYDYDNRLVLVVKDGDGETRIVTFKYDPFGRRIEKKIEEIEDGCFKTKIYTYVYDNEDIILEYLTNADGNNEKVELTRYVHGPGIDEPLAIEQKGKVYFYHADGLGSIVSLTDSKGKVVQTYEYDSFGNLHDQKNRIKQPYTYTGREWDKEIGLYFYRARYYDPAVGRFISEDPIGFAGGDVNLYSYVQNDPINWIDPDGLIRIPGAGKAIGWGLKRLAKTLGGKLGKKLGEWSDFFNPEIGHPPEQQEMDKDSDKDGINDYWDNDDDNDGIPDAQDDTPKGPNNTEKPCE